MLLVLLVSAALQGLWAPWVRLGGVKPPLLLCVALYYALVHDRGMALTAAILAGLLLDALSLIPLGYSSFIYTLIVVALGHWRERIFVRQVWTHIFCGALAGVAALWAVWIILAAQNLIPLALPLLLARTLGALLLGAVTLPVMYQVIFLLDGWVGNVEGRTA